VFGMGCCAGSAHRGLLIDTSRHYQPPAVLEQVLESMAYAKLNVFHWHMVDQQAFPIEVPSFPAPLEGGPLPPGALHPRRHSQVVSFAAERVLWWFQRLMSRGMRRRGCGLPRALAVPQLQDAPGRSPAIPPFTSSAAFYET